MPHHSAVMNNPAKCLYFNTLNLYYKNLNLKWFLEETKCKNLSIFTKEKGIKHKVSTLRSYMSSSKPTGYIWPLRSYILFITGLYTTHIYHYNICTFSPNLKYCYLLDGDINEKQQYF